MLRKPLIAFGVFLLFLLVASVLYGGGWSPFATGDSLRVAGQGYGLGRVDQASINAHLEGSLVCVNPGGNVAPGQQSFVVNLTATQVVTVRNGKFNFDFYFPDEAFGFSPSNPAGAGCPNGNWTVDYVHDRLQFTLREIEDGVPVARTAATFNCVMNPPALSGTYSCSSS